MNNPEYLIYLDYLLLFILSFSTSQQLFSSKFNFYGITAILSISLYFSLHSIYSNFNILALLMFISAIIFIILELFVPGGILGILGILVLGYALVSINKINQYIVLAIVVSLIVFVIMSLLNIYLFKKKMLFLNKLILKDKLLTEEGYIANKSDISLVGKELKAYTDLRPAGIAILDGKKYDVVSQGEFIEKNSSLIVTETIGMRIVVRKK
ncbi:serine peptidase [Gemella sp. 19428wG2_WT2a]|nr:serine peptidase [Gemella sp. 19428wG2_WT2a]